MLVLTVLFVLIGCSLFVAIGFLFAFIWAVKSGQFKDLQTPAIRMLFDDTAPHDDGKKETPPVVK